MESLSDFCEFIFKIHLDSVNLPALSFAELCIMFYNGLYFYIGEKESVLLQSYVSGT